jgi:ferredoxin-NADP reductase
MKLTLNSIHKEFADVTTFSFTPPAEIGWKAGQYMHYVLPHDNPDDRGTERWFTIAAPPQEQLIKITTRYTVKSSSFKKALFAMEPGAEIEADGPEGDFTLLDPQEEFVFIAGGIGITPFRAILLDLDNRQVPITGRLLYANRDENIIFRAELDALVEKHPGFSVEYVLSPARIDAEYIRSNVPDINIRTFYISGPEPMVKSLAENLGNIGVPSGHIKLDDFPGYEWPQV